MRAPRHAAGPPVSRLSSHPPRPNAVASVLQEAAANSRCDGSGNDGRGRNAVERNSSRRQLSQEVNSTRVRRTTGPRSAAALRARSASGTNAAVLQSSEASSDMDPIGSIGSTRQRGRFDSPPCVQKGGRLSRNSRQPGVTLPRLPPKAPVRTAVSGASETVFGMHELITRMVECMDLAGLCTWSCVSPVASYACSADALWEKICHKRWPKSPLPALPGEGGWKGAFFARLQQAQRMFKANTLPTLVSKARRKDGFPDLAKLQRALRLRYSLLLQLSGSVSEVGREKTLPLSQDSVQVFANSVCIRCSFTSLKFRTPFQMKIIAHSAALGSDAAVLDVALTSESAWQECATSDDHFCFLRSPCGQVLAGLWQGDRTVAGLFVSVHHLYSLRPFLQSAPAGTWERLAGRPESDDIDSKLGLHDYTVQVCLRSAKVEGFSQCLYKIISRRDGEFARAEVDHQCVVSHTLAAWQVSDVHGEDDMALRAKPTARGRQGGALSMANRRQPSSGRPTGPARLTGKYSADVANFDVVTPHLSGETPPYVCAGQLRVVFQTMAFRCILPDTTFLDCTVFDEHGHVFWAISSVVSLTNEVPHSALVRQASAVDFDRDDAGEDGDRWLCVADCGISHLALQFSAGYNAGGFSTSTSSDLDVPMRLNSMSWHPELCHINRWFQSNYTLRSSR
mmetsp:Transcript_64264/g.114140  ORF Transcript_64264/g.114140 Transcript_64264/m.114140 type:complete len:681 (+) Transcript_64264:45-2087(+)